MKFICSLPWVLVCIISSLRTAEAFGTNDSILMNARFERNKSQEKAISFEVKGSSTEWKKFLSYRFSDRLDMGIVRTGYLGTGLGLEYHMRREIIVWCAVVHAHETRAKVPMIGISSEF